MSLKPEVARVRGVHSVTNSSQGGDIGFPQLQLEKLFEAATVKELESGAEYTEGKKYAYLNPNWPKTDPNKYLSIENKAHFYCVRDGYCGLDGSVDHYYTKEGDDYKNNSVPPTGSWDKKLEFSNAIKDKELYSISKEEERIYIEGQGYYLKKENKGYEKQGQINYTTFEAKEFNWNDSKYECKNLIAEDPETGEIITNENGVIVVISTWQNSIGELAESGNYIYVKALTTNNTIIYQVKLLYIEFSEGVWEPGSASLYKLPEGFSTANLYVKNGQKIVKLSDNEVTLDNDPATDNSIYYTIGEWNYPNTIDPSNVESISLLSETNGIWGSFNQADFPLFTGAALSGISKVSNDPHTVYKKLAVTVNYKYSSNNNLKFIFTNKSVPEVLEACNLKSILPSKYVHLTNLEYTTDMA